MRLSTNEHVDCLYQTIIKEAEFNTFLCFLRHGLTLNVLYTYDFFLKKLFCFLYPSLPCSGFRVPRFYGLNNGMAASWALAFICV